MFWINWRGCQRNDNSYNEGETSQDDCKVQVMNLKHESNACCCEFFICSYEQCLIFYAKKKIWALVVYS